MNKFHGIQMRIWGKLLREARHDSNLTQYELSRRSGITACHISHFETGKRTPTIHNAVKLCLALNMSLDHVFMSDLQSYYKPRPVFNLLTEK